MVQNVDKKVKLFYCFICLFRGFLICRFKSEQRSSPFKDPLGCDRVAGEPGTGASVAEGRGHVRTQNASPLPAAAPKSLRPGTEDTGLVSPLLRRGLSCRRVPSSV